MTTTPPPLGQGTRGPLFAHHTATQGSIIRRSRRRWNRNLLFVSTFECVSKMDDCCKICHQKNIYQNRSSTMHWKKHCEKTIEFRFELINLASFAHCWPTAAAKTTTDLHRFSLEINNWEIYFPTKHPCTHTHPRNALHTHRQH